jgi:hypothetical protein
MNGTQTEFYFRLLLLTCLSKFHSKLAENLHKGFRCPKKIFLILLFLCTTKKSFYVLILHVVRKFD